MNPRRNGLILYPFVALSLMGCRPELGAPDYSGMPDPSAPIEQGDILPGPDPYQPGELRLSLGAFYEGGASQIIPIDSVQSSYFIYADEFRGNALTYDQEEEREERLEGQVSDRIIHGGGPWWGGGVHWSEARDLGDFNYLSISLRSEDVTFEDLEIRVGSDAVEGAIVVSDYGFISDGEWHTLELPLDDYAAIGVDINAVLRPLVLVGAGADGGETLLIDNVYFSRE